MLVICATVYMKLLSLLTAKGTLWKHALNGQCDKLSGSFSR